MSKELKERLADVSDCEEETIEELTEQMLDVLDE